MPTLPLPQPCQSFAPMSQAAAGPVPVAWVRTPLRSAPLVVAGLTVGFDLGGDRPPLQGQRADIEADNLSLTGAGSRSWR